MTKQANPAAFQTRLARKFVSLAEDVTEAFSEVRIGAGAWTVELTAPSGMSTGGGKQALQHLRLRPGRSGNAVLVAGTVNSIEKHAELRDYEYVCMMHEVRFRRGLRIAPDEWEKLLAKAEAVLGDAGIQCARVGPPSELVQQRNAMTRLSRLGLAALVFVLALAGLVVWRIVGSS